jgi:hypothetical protein
MVRKTTIAKYLAEIGGRGGKARLRTMTPEERKAVASQGGKASGKARAAKKAAKDRKR